ncbi:MAG: DUF6485 family protein [Candidatus Omnitrophota bacterium]
MSTCQNKVKCTCTYGGCDKHGKCCECLQYHLRMKELPACCFPPQVERTYDRSFRKFIDTYK